MGVPLQRLQALAPHFKQRECSLFKATSNLQETAVTSPPPPKSISSPSSALSFQTAKFHSRKGTLKQPTLRPGPHPYPSTHALGNPKESLDFPVLPGYQELQSVDLDPCQQGQAACPHLCILGE